MHSLKTFSYIPNIFTNKQSLRKSHTSKVRLIYVSSKKLSQDNIHQEQKLSWKDKLKQWYEAVQVFVGLADIKKAHERVTHLSRKAQGYASVRREIYEKLEDIHNQRYYDYQKMAHTNVESEEYSKLQDKHYELKNQLRVLRKGFRTCERNERETFEQLFISMRDCNRKEGYLAEQSKYWSLIATIISAILASFFTSLNNWSRFKELREMTEEVAHKEIKISSGDLNQFEAIVKEATDNVSEKMVDNEIKMSSEDLNQIKAIVKCATENVSEKMVDKEIKISSENLDEIEAIVKNTIEDVSNKMGGKEIKISSDYLNQIAAIVKEATENVSEKIVYKEFKISSDNLNQIEAIVKESTENVSEKIIDKHYSSGISKAMADERRNRALVAGVGIGVSIGSILMFFLYVLLDPDD